MKRVLLILLSIAIIINVCSVSSVNSYAETRIKLDSTMIKGASIRLVEPNGIRWYTQVDTAKIAQLKQEGHTVTMGTLIAPVDTLEAELTQKTEIKVDVPYTADEYFTEDNFTGIVGSIIKILEKNTGFNKISGNIYRNFVGRGYVCVDGFYSYATQNDNMRSINQVAADYKSSLSTSAFNALSETQKSNINRWISAFNAENLLGMVENKTAEPESLGFPAADYIVDKNNTYAQNIWDMAVVNNKVVMGYGDYGENSGAAYGGTPLFFFTNESNKKRLFKIKSRSDVTDNVLSTEAAQRFFMIDGTLFTISTDPLLMNNGSYYAYDSDKNKWTDYYKLPWSIHCYDMIKFDGDYYFAGMVQDGKQVIDYCVQKISGNNICTDTNAQNIELYDFEGKRLDGPSYSSTDGTTRRTTYYWRAYDIFAFKGELYVAHSFNSGDTSSKYSGLFKYNKTKNAFYQVTDGTDLKGFMAVARNNTIDMRLNGVSHQQAHYDFETNTVVAGPMKVGIQEIYDEVECPFEEEIGGKLIVVKNGIFKSSNVEARSGAFEKVSLGSGYENYVVRDAFEHNGKYYFLASVQNGTNDFTTAVFETNENVSTFKKGCFV